MYVENPLELQMLFGDKIFLDEKELLAVGMGTTEAANSAEEISQKNTRAINFFLDVEATKRAGFPEMGALLGKMLLVTQLDGKIPTMELAEIFDLINLSEHQFTEKVRFGRKNIVFSDHWPFEQKTIQNMQVFSFGGVRLFYAPSISTIMNDIERKKAFATGLKNYFSEE